VNAMPLIIIALAIFVLAYRFYYSFIVAKVVTINELNKTPADRLYDGSNYIPMKKWILFGHHFAAIAGAGPLVGPVLAAQFGYFPGFAWMVLGAVIAGSVHDFVIFVASIRHDGKSLAEIAKDEIGKLSGITVSFTTLIILIIAMAGLSIVVVNALSHSPWGTFTIASTIPIAILMGLWMFRFRKGKTVEATIIGVVLLVAAVIYGKEVPGTALGNALMFEHHTLTILLCMYGFFASVLPVWLLLTPRDYLSSFMKLGVVVFLALGVIIVMPDMHMPAFTSFTKGGGPIIPGALFPYLFITIACGAISGFHSLVSSGTSPKMLDNEKHIKMISMGAMLSESMVSILALIAACSLLPMDYFQINIPVDKFPLFADQLRAMGFNESNLTMLSKEVGEELAGRTGGAVTFAVGMAHIFSKIPGLEKLMSYWYHFAIMFEALFILTTIDAGTRIARFILQELLGKVYKPFGQTNWLPGNLIASSVVVFAWGYFCYTGNVTTIWPMFGAANQLLATVALVVGTSYIINRGKVKYSWVTIVPLVFVGVVTTTSGIMNMFNIYLPLISTPGKELIGWINFLLTGIIIACVLTIFLDSLPRWYKVVKNKSYITDAGIAKV